MSDNPLRRPGLLRRHGRSGLQEDLPVAAGDGQARPPQRTGHRRGQGRLDLDQLRRGRATAWRSTAGSIRPRSTSLCGLLRYVDGDYQDPGHLQASCKELGGAERPAHYLAIPPVLFGPWSSTLAAGGLRAAGARVIVEKPFGRDLASAQALNRILLRQLRRERDLPHRPLPRKAAGAQHALFPLRQRDAGAVLEPDAHRERPDHHGGGFRRPGPRRVLRQAGAIRDVVQNHSSRCWPIWPWSRRPARTASRSATKR